ncbi:primase-helicase family protein [Paraburkholderia aromaticivorans]|uniref:primase-helicase family protein n=1 Tax=Paraburkholderia aromaticivorans TaxID=2026199 RepID=UPI0038BB2509
MTTINEHSENVNTDVVTNAITKDIQSDSKTEQQTSTEQLDRPNAEDKNIDDDLFQYGYEFATIDDLKEFEKCKKDFAKYALIRMGGKTSIVYQSEDRTAGLKYDFSSIRDFHDFHKDRHFYIYDNRKATKKYYSHLWLESSHLHRKYDYVTFNPDPDFKDSRAFNFWTGFVTPKKGDVTPFLNHIDKLIIGTKEQKDHLIKLLAYTVRYPHKQTGTSVALRGKQGGGKSTLSNTMQDICPDNSKSIDDIDLIFGFNDTTVNTKYFLMEESVWGGEKGKEGRLKHAITAETRNIAVKHHSGTTIANYAFYIFTSNEDWIVPVGVNDRRFNIFDCSDQLIGNSKYFEDYYKWLRKDGGKHHLVHYFLHEIDLTGFNPQKVITNDAKSEVMVRSLRSIEKYLFNILAGEIDYDEIEAQDWLVDIKVNREGIFQHFREHSAAFASSKVDISEFSKALSKIFGFPKGWATNWKGSKVKPFYKLPNRAECQRLFAEFISADPNMLFETYNQFRAEQDDFDESDPLAPPPPQPPVRPGRPEAPPPGPRKSTIVSAKDVLDMCQKRYKDDEPASSEEEPETLSG